MPRGVWLEDLTWPEAKARLEADAVVILPIGAVVRLDRAVPDYGEMRERPATVIWEPARFTGEAGQGIDTSATGVRGDPTLATAAKGEALLVAMAEELIAGIRALHGAALA